MSAAFIRRYLSDPGIEVLLEIESVNVLDLDPPASISGVGTGTVLMPAEFENGPFNTPMEVSSANDLKAVFGSFGHTYGGTQGNNPCARKRTADSGPAEYWNGNGVIQLNGKKFKRLILVRVDTSVGSVALSRCAFIAGAAAQLHYALTSGQTLLLDTGSPATATFTGAAATVLGGTFTSPTTFTGVETLTLGYDGAPDFTVAFTVADQLLADVVARINLFAGITFASADSSKLRLTGQIKGTSGQVRVVSASAGVLTILGLTPATTAGTGNVANIALVTPAEVNTIAHAADGNVIVDTDAAGLLRMVNTGVPETGTLKIGSGSTATAFGFAPLGTVVAADECGTAGVIPAGTRVQNVGGTEWVTMQDVDVTVAGVGPYTVKVRPALDDGSVGTALANTVTVIYDTPGTGAFVCDNPFALTPALTEAQLDAAYQTAIDATLDINSVARETNIIYSARQSNAVRRGLRTNALDASANGCYGRCACVRPPMNTAKAVAKSTSAEPGVGAYRDQRVFYTYPNAATFVPSIARIGLTGGAGFTADGVVDVGADGFLASVLSQLPPEENPGQDNPYLTGVVALESGSNAVGFNIVDYTNFRAAGICALRIDGGKAFFQSGVTSVDPAVYPNLRNIARRRMADFIQDTLSIRLTGFIKKLNSIARRNAVVGEVRAWMGTLVSAQNPSSSRIDGYEIDLTANTPTTIAMGLFRIILRVRTLSSLDSIVLETTIGESVTLSEAA